MLAALLALTTLSGCPAPPGAPVRERPRTSIKRDQSGKVWIQGIGPIRGFARGRDNTFMHSLELVLDATGRKIGYDELMGISGLAFRLQFRVDRWDVGNPDGLVGEDCLKVLFPAVGWNYEVRIVRLEEVDEVAALRLAIRRSINRGVPVLAANVIPPEDWGILTGYDGNKRWLCRSYNGGAAVTNKPAKGWPTAVVLLTRRLARPSARKAHVASIRRAVELFEQRKSGVHALGDKAFDHWCQSLHSVRDRSYIHANFWTYIGLIDARSAAVRYLKAIAKEFGPRRTHLIKASNWYDKEVRLLLEGLDHVPQARAPKSLPPIEMRKRQIDVLRRARKMERNAIASLKRAL